MQGQKNNSLKDISSLKTPIITALVCFLILYAIIGIVLIFTSEKNVLSSISKILAPLGIIGIATVVSVDCFHKMTNDQKIVRMFGLLTFIFGIITVILSTLIIWELIPDYVEEEVESTYRIGYYYTTMVPTLAYKINLSLLSITGFTFLGSIVLSSKENHPIIKSSKYVATGFLAIASLVSILTNFIDFSEDDIFGSARIGLLQAVSWITAISLGAAVFYFSKTISWEEKASKQPTEPNKPASPSVKEPIVAKQPIPEAEPEPQVIHESTPEPLPENPSIEAEDNSLPPAPVSDDSLQSDSITNSFNQ